VETLLHAGLSNAVTATFLALFVACLGRVIVRRPAILHCLWLVVLLKLVTPPLYEVAIPWPSVLSEVREREPDPVPVGVEPMAGIGEYALALPQALETPEVRVGEIVLEPLGGADPAAAGTESNPVLSSPTERLPLNWMTLLATAWLAGTLVVLVLTGRRVWRFERLLRQAEPACEDAQQQVDELAQSLGLVRAPSVWWIGGSLSPLVWAIGRHPRLIIPRALWKSLDDRQRSTLIVHELAHLLRGDHHVRILEFIVTALFWWHPVVWWVRRALHDAEEQCCDAWVVWACPESAKSYALTLLETLDFLNQSDQSVPLLASGFGKVHHLRKRLTMIMSGTTPRLLGVRGSIATLGMAALLLPFSASWAQQPDQKQEVRVIVRTDDGSSNATAATAEVADITSTINVDQIGLGDLVLNVNGETITTQDSEHPNVVHLEVKTDDSSVSVTAESVKEAIAKLKEQINALAAKSSPSDREKAKKALDRVVKELESQLTKQSKSGERRVYRVEKGKPENQVELKVLDGKELKHIVGKAELGPGMKQINLIEKRVEHSADKDLSPETKAKIEKARAEVKEIARSLEANQRRLIEAKRKLSQLEGGNNPLTVELRALPKVVARAARLPQVIQAPDSDDVLVFTNKKVENDKPSDKKPVQAKRFVITERTEKREGGEPSQSRIEELEKKLQRLLEEVASLKKERAK
jgi:beta-lactamase regulating signal transducer with metallopeptidase domain